MPSIGEFDAYLSGVYADWLMRTHQPVPAWAWVNRLAHSTTAELRHISHGSGLPPTNDSDVVLWHQVVVFLAREVLDHVADDGQLRDVQRRVLIPLELRLADKWWYALPPLDVATLVLVALENAPHRQ